LIPSGEEDLALNLDICDHIRSKQVSAKEAASVLKKRISHKNPNIQLLALKVFLWRLLVLHLPNRVAS
jgi:growth factor-regulated tyrosine kinase substrate